MVKKDKCFFGLLSTESCGRLEELKKEVRDLKIDLTVECNARMWEEEKARHVHVFNMVCMKYLKKCEHVFEYVSKLYEELKTVLNEMQGETQDAEDQNSRKDSAST